MSSYKDIIDNYRERREQQVINIGNDYTDLSTYEGRELLRQNMQLADDPYTIEVASPGHIAPPPSPHTPLTAYLYCEHLIQLVASHTTTCKSGCTCYLESCPPPVAGPEKNETDLPDNEKHVGFRDTRIFHDRETKSRNGTKRTYARPDAALLFDL